jgi:hypothetical protein
VICGAIVGPGRTGQGLAAQLITALRDLAPQAGCQRVLAPVRPTLKPAYPLTPIDTFARRTRPDGAPLDPWLRTHRRLGGQIIATAPHSQTMTGTVQEWEAWTGTVLPATGEYVIPRGLSTSTSTSTTTTAPTPSPTSGSDTGNHHTDLAGRYRNTE